MDEVRDSFRPSVGGWLLGSLAGWGTVLLALGGIAATIAVAGEWGAWPLLITALAVLIVLAKWIKAMGVRYDLTPERLIVRRGIVFKSIDEVELYRVKDVRMDFSVVNQLAGIGRICVTSSDETTRLASLVMPDVPRAQARREDLRRLVDTARQQRRVREIDMVHEDY
jgi:uncharacterized membrane protein YdbT with pleckstrin-like domain